MERFGRIGTLAFIAVLWATGVYAAGPATQPPPPPAAQAAGPTTYAVPPAITVELKGKTGGGGLGTWIPVISAIIAAIAAISAAGFTATQGARSQAQLQAGRLVHEVTLAESGRVHDRTSEDRRLEQAREELRRNTQLTEMEIEQTARKAVHEQRIEEAKLLHLFFDKLVSTDEREQRLALFAVSAFVDASVIEQFAAGGGVVTAGNLSKLAASATGEASSAAQTILNRGWESARPSLVVILNRASGSESAAVGFFITETLIATLLIAEVGGEVTVFWPEPKRHVQGRCVAKSVSAQAMLVQVEREGRGPPLSLAPPDADGAVLGDALTLTQLTHEGRLIVRTGKATGVDVDNVRIHAGGPNPIRLDNLIETDIPSEPGVGGSPVFDSRGAVVGLLVAGSSRFGVDGATAPISYAAPASELSTLLNQAAAAVSA